MLPPTSPSSPRTGSRATNLPRLVAIATLAVGLAVAPLDFVPSATPTGAAAAATKVASAGSTTTTTRDVLFSARPDRSGSRTLHGSSHASTGSLYVHAGVPSGWRHVKFWLNDPKMAGKPVRTDSAAPFDLVGNTATGTATPLQLSTLKPGSHTITASIKLGTGVNHVRHATFTVGSTPAAAPAPAPAPVPTPPPAPAPAPVPDPAPAPAQSGRPSATTTGVKAGTVLKSSGALTVRQNGAVVENLDIAGSLTIQAHGVTVRNVRVRSSSTSYGINVANGFGGTLIENVEVQVGVNGTTANAAIGGMGDHQGIRGKAHGSNVTVRSSYIHGIGDGIKATDYSLYEGNFIRMRRAGGSVKHIDGIQGSGRSHWTVRHNYIDQAYGPGQNAAVFAQPYTGTYDKPISNIIIERNWVNGGGYTIQLGDAKDGRSGLVTGVHIADNIFYRDYKYGVVLTRSAKITGNGGVWADTGARVPHGRIG